MKQRRGFFAFATGCLLSITVAGCGIFLPIRESPANRTSSILQRLKLDIFVYENRCGGTITTSAEILAKLTDDCAASVSREANFTIGRLYRTSPAAASDAWGIPFSIKIIAGQRRLFSLGADAQPGGSGDDQDIEVSLDSN